MWVGSKVVHHFNGFEPLWAKKIGILSHFWTFLLGAEFLVVYVNGINVCVCVCVSNLVRILVLHSQWNLPKLNGSVEKGVPSPMCVCVCVSLNDTIGAIGAMVYGYYGYVGNRLYRRKRSAPTTGTYTCWESRLCTKILHFKQLFNRAAQSKIQCSHNFVAE